MFKSSEVGGERVVWVLYLFLHLSLPVLMLSMLTRCITTVPVTEKTHVHFTIEFALPCLHVSMCVFIYDIISLP